MAHDIEALKARIIAAVDRNADAITRLSDDIWAHPEIGFHEDYAAAALRGLLAGCGFTIENGVAGMPTAFIATFGSASPKIGFLGEFDALAGFAGRGGVRPDAPGHACGHNLLGAGSVAAAIAAKELICEGLISGTVVYFGCPAEETGSGKAFMARASCFDGVDALLSWHPWDVNGAWTGSTMANVALQFRFNGRSAHAAEAPELGRSALDALEIMNVGVQFLREHVPEDTRIHYAITDAGGSAPNVVQAHAEARYLVRSPRIAELDGIYRRVIDCAKGAAMIAGTDVEVEFIKGCSNILPNFALSAMLDECMRLIGLPRYSDAELETAAALQKTIESPSDTVGKFARHMPPKLRGDLNARRGHILNDFILPHNPVEGVVIPISTDVGDASRCAPTGQILAAAWPAGTPAHSRQAAAMGTSGIAHGAELFAAKVLALCAARLMSDADGLDCVRREFAARIAEQPYICPIPKDVQPKL